MVVNNRASMASTTFTVKWQPYGGGPEYEVDYDAAPPGTETLEEEVGRFIDDVLDPLRLDVKPDAEARKVSIFTLKPGENGPV